MCINKSKECDGCMDCYDQPCCPVCGREICRDKPWHDFEKYCSDCLEKFGIKKEE